jgi:hypothetical protein
VIVMPRQGRGPGLLTAIVPRNILFSKFMYLKCARLCQKAARKVESAKQSDETRQSQAHS